MPANASVCMHVSVNVLSCLNLPIKLFHSPYLIRLIINNEWSLKLGPRSVFKVFDVSGHDIPIAYQVALTTRNTKNYISMFMVSQSIRYRLIKV